MTQERKDLVFLHFIIGIWGFTAVLGKLITIPSVELVFYRTALAAIGLWVVISILNKSFKIERRADWYVLILSGFLFGIHWITFFMSVKVSNVTTCLVGMSSTALWTSILEPIFYKERISKLKLLFSALGIGGILIIFRVDMVSMNGLMLALVSSGCASLFTIFNARLVRNIDHFTITFYEMLIAFIAISIFLPFYGKFITQGPLSLAPGWLDWVYILILSVLCTVFAYSYAVMLMKRLRPFTINFTINLEPVYGIILALLVFGKSEIMTPKFYLGATFLLISVLMYPLISRRIKPKSGLSQLKL